MSAPVWLTTLVWVVSALTMINAGIYVAFSTFTLPALRTLPARDAMQAMQRINEKAPRSAFMVAFIGSALGGAAIIVASLLVRPGSLWWLVAGGAAAIVAFFITAGVNVPLNNALAAASDHTASEAWPRFHRPWAAANHLRGLVSVVGAVLLTIGAVSA
jgi:uncharacterized membrane protein